MNWKFWKKESQNEPLAANGPKLAKPKELPEPVGRKMVTVMKLDPDLVWSLKYVSRPLGDRRNASEFRIFNPESAHIKGITVKNWTSLDDLPDLILYSGSYDKSSNSIDIH
ncbi:hypothetical protein [uncultured Desulfosarcina sp.]|uniref:hypothetical protein n=1 Tax=uncultured Desulfosarcina sp. TaxID=218289 RepID=UPI0029C8174A|nr:hypothetical protein [uncultured Desulfosarcina sp.]